MDVFPASPGDSPSQFVTSRGQTLLEQRTDGAACLQYFIHAMGHGTVLEVNIILLNCLEMGKKMFFFI